MEKIPAQKLNLSMIQLIKNQNVNTFNGITNIFLSIIGPKIEKVFTFPFIRSLGTREKKEKTKFNFIWNSIFIHIAYSEQG